MTPAARKNIVAFGSGLLFAVGLGVSGMTNAAKVVGFLNPLGREGLAAWDPSLAFVMMGAIGVHLFFAQRAKKPSARPVFAERYELPSKTAIDAKLVSGSALFGLGWGAAGFCPGPALVVVTTLATRPLVFVGAMIAGMLLASALFTSRKSANERALLHGE